MSKYYYALWIPVLRKTRFDIIGHPKSKTLQDSEEFESYIIQGNLEERTLHFSLRYKKGKKGDEKCLLFRCEDKWDIGFLIYSVELDDSPKDSLEESLHSKMPTFIYHYIKDFFHVHIHHHPSHDSLLHAFFSEAPLSFRNAVDRQNIIEHYALHYQQKFRAYISDAQSIFAIAKQNINSRLSINKGIRQLDFLLNGGREILGEVSFCCALMEMGASSIAKKDRKCIYDQRTQIEELQAQVSFSYNLCTSSYGIRLGYWGIWFGVAGILVSALSIFLSLCSSPDYSPVIIRIDSLDRERKERMDSVVETERKKTELRLDTLSKQIKDIHTLLHDSALRVSFPKRK